MTQDKDKPVASGKDAAPTTSPSTNDVTETPAQATASPEPAADTPEPATETPVAPTEPPAPATETPASATETPTPAADTPAPATETPTSATDTPASPINGDAATARSGSAGLWLALLDLLAIIGLGAGGYLMLQNLEHQRFSQQQSLDALGQTVNQLDVAKQGREQWFNDTEERGRQAQRAIAELQREQNQAEQRQEKAEAALGRLANQIQGGRAAWQRAEIEQLLLLANTRLQLQRDLHGAKLALELADGRLASLSNPAYFTVREKIADELTRLAAVPRVDAQALALKLDSLINQVDALATRPTKVGVFDTNLQLSGGNIDGPWYQRAWVSIQQAVGSLVSIRRDAERREPLLPPEQGFYLRQNLRLQLESARLASLKLDTANFAAALGQAENWIRRYFDPQQAASKAALQSIGQLRALELKPALPDISGSLNALRHTELGA